MPTNETGVYDETTPLGEPIEIRTVDAMGNRYVLVAWLDADTYTIGYDYVSASGSTPYALSNMQAKLTFPRKAVPGWQREVFNFVASGLGTIEEVR